MNRTLACALALAGFAGTAQAADLGLDGLKDPLPDTLTYKGVTIYGTVDVGYAYQSNGYSPSGYFYPGLNYSMKDDKTANQSQSTIIGNPMSQSAVGLKVEESLGMGFVAIGKIETGFNPTYGELADACKSLLQSKTSTLAADNKSYLPSGTASADGSRCGQAFNGEVYAGLSNAAYGTLTVGRQNSLIQSGLSTYDPIAGSYAFSLLAYSGGAAGGIGSTETARWDNSVKYVYQYGPAHAAVMYSSGSSDSAIVDGGHGIGANLGFSWKGLSLDGYYTKEDGAVNLSALSPTQLYGVVTNNEAWSAMGKYTFNVNPLFGFGAGGYKDDAGAKVTLFAGYVHMDMKVADDQGQYNGDYPIGGYQFYTANPTGVGTISAPSTWVGTKTLQTEWTGASYAVGAWTFTGAYYHFSQDTFGTACTKGGSSNSACSGGLNFEIVRG